ncbi:MAG: YciK family oxidoreductase [Porticoccus sp.]|jgi:NAD(P)-dependent dehydrogenase (short-subunit alcohol dehydrogenase family)|nr:YciK family oxidoreductase [Porticoccus sp.]
MKHKTFRAPKGYLKEKVIAITGASDGIGAIAAKTFAAFGATIILIGRSVPKLEKVYDAIESAGGPTPAIYPICLENASEHDYLKLYDNISEVFTGLDGLLHSAAILGERTPIENYAARSWEAVMRVNVSSQFMLTKTMLPLLRNSENASLVFTTSSVGRTGKAYWGAYAVSKFATEGLSQVLASELEDTCNIRVNCINPGALSTRMRALAFPAENPTKLKKPEDVMPSYLYLIGDESISISGASLDAQ